MRKQITLFLLLTVICVTAFCPIKVNASAPLEPSSDSGLTLHYQKNDVKFADLQISIYRIAQALPDGTFELIEPFSSYPINIHNITEQKQWENTAETLNSFITANQIAPHHTEKTDENGTARFENLETGLYLVSEVVAENNNGTYIFNRFMVYLPTPQADGSFNYKVEAKPKCADYIPKTEYRVTKLWQDSGHRFDRPKEITVDIYKDDILQESQILSESNNWSYIWRVSDNDYSEWTVAERSVSNKYTVVVQKNGSSFSIINTHKSSGANMPDSPQTGDENNLTHLILIISVAVGVMVISGIYGRRKSRYEKA